MRILCAILVFSLYALTAMGQEVLKARTPSGYVSISKDPPKPPFLEIEKGSLSFTDSDGNRVIDANENSWISFRLRNSGMGPGLNLVADIKETNAVPGIRFDAQKMLGNLEKDKTLDVRIPVSGNMYTRDAKAVFAISIEEANGFGTDPVYFEVSTRAFLAPMVKVVDSRISSQTGTTIQKNRPFTVQVLVQNMGQGTAENVSVLLPIPANMFCLSGNEREEIGSLKPGETRLVEYSLITNNNYAASDIKLNFKLTEKLGKYTEDSNLTVAMNQQVSSEKLVVEGRQQNLARFEAGSLSSGVDKNIPVLSTKNPDRIALIIGNEDYSGTFDAETDVPFARNDARIFSEYARNTMGVEERNLFVLLDATSGEMRREIDRVASLLEKIGQTGELIFYYAGHGYPEENTRVPYLIPVDVNAANLTTAVSVKEMYEKFGNSGAGRVTVFLDACFSGGGRGQGLLTARGLRVKPKTEGISGNMIVFSASSGEQSSLSYEKEQHGMFTYFLLKKIQDTKGLVSYPELSEYIRKEVSVESLRVNGREQDPEVLVSPVLGERWKEWRLGN